MILIPPMSLLALNWGENMNRFTRAFLIAALASIPLWVIAILLVRYVW